MASMTQTAPRTTKDPGLDRPFAQAARCPTIPKPIRAARTKKEALTAHLKALKRVQYRRDQITNFLNAVEEANGFGQRWTMHHTHVPDVRTAQVAALDLELMKSQLA